MIIFTGEDSSFVWIGLVTAGQREFNANHICGRIVDRSADLHNDV